VLLVGSVGLKDSEEVFSATVGAASLAARMKAHPGRRDRAADIVGCRGLRFVLEDNPSFEDDPQEVAAGGRITHPTEGTRTWKGSGPSIAPRRGTAARACALKAGVATGRAPASAGSVYPEAAIDSYKGPLRVARSGRRAEALAFFRFPCRPPRRF